MYVPPIQFIGLYKQAKLYNFTRIFQKLLSKPKGLTRTHFNQISLPVLMLQRL